ncbi:MULTISPECIES: AlpA family transcriptional regulator [unclassified Mesorhizobium]|uniref:helix-turn-helix transcriptional regulator n=1 Tax=unclassified Mesorhizobium TaxID=325217 RepID=UPI001FE224BB|nr:MULTISPECIES: AlpA family phage regulatory protein [unclassified Mesorhizobium]
MDHSNDNLPPLLLRIGDVERMIGLGRSSIYRKMETGFPHPVALGPGSVRWRYADVKSWADGLQSAA